MMYVGYKCGYLKKKFKLDFKDIYCILIMILGGIDYIDVIKGKFLLKD